MGAQWLLVDYPSASVLVSLVQVMDTVPDLLFAVVGVNAPGRHVEPVGSIDQACSGRVAHGAGHSVTVGHLSWVSR